MADMKKFVMFSKFANVIL